jgi:hypothetical protein
VKVRAWVRLVACAWLASQLASFAAAPFAIYASGAGTTPLHDDARCCPGLKPGQVCPMHHTREGGTRCRLSAACSGDGAALILIVGNLAFVPGSSAIEPIVRSRAIAADIATPLYRTLSPDSPPPRL